jgi:hypothetical protein
MKEKGAIEIGHRMVAELYRLYPNRTDRSISRMLGVSNHTIADWRNGVTPGGHSLSILAHMGGDVNWVLKGGNRNGK